MAKAVCGYCGEKPNGVLLEVDRGQVKLPSLGCWPCVREDYLRLKALELGRQDG